MRFRAGRAASVSDVLPRAMVVTHPADGEVRGGGERHETEILVDKPQGDTARGVALPPEHQECGVATRAALGIAGIADAPVLRIGLRNEAAHRARALEPITRVDQSMKAMGFRKNPADLGAISGRNPEVAFLA